MVRLGFWIVFGALACMAVTFLPAVIGGDASDFQFVADALFCDGDQAVVMVNLSEAALAKGNLGSVVSGFCADSGGRRLGPIPASRFADRLTLMIAAGLFGVLLIGLGTFRKAGRTAITTAAEPGSASPASLDAARTYRRDAEDLLAHNQANYRRSQIPVSPPRPAASPAATPDWMLGLTSTAAPSAEPSQRFEFGEASPPTSDLQIQLNMLQLAYESSLITRSEYDARRAALIGGQGADSAAQ